MAMATDYLADPRLAAVSYALLRGFIAAALKSSHEDADWAAFEVRQARTITVTEAQRAFDACTSVLSLAILAEQLGIDLEPFFFRVQMQADRAKPWSTGARARRAKSASSRGSALQADQGGVSEGSAADESATEECATVEEPAPHAPRERPVHRPPFELHMGTHAPGFRRRQDHREQRLQKVVAEKQARREDARRLRQDQMQAAVERTLQEHAPKEPGRQQPKQGRRVLHPVKVLEEERPELMRQRKARLRVEAKLEEQRRRRLAERDAADSRGERLLKGSQLLGQQSADALAHQNALRMLSQGQATARSHKKTDSEAFATHVAVGAAIEGPASAVD